MKSLFYKFTDMFGCSYYLRGDTVVRLEQVAAHHPIHQERHPSAPEDRKTIQSLVVVATGGEDTRVGLREGPDEIAHRLNHDVRGVLNGAITELQNIYNVLKACDAAGCGEISKGQIAEKLEHQADNLLEALEAIYGAGARVVA